MLGDPNHIQGDSFACVRQETLLFRTLGCLPAELFPCFCMETDKRHQKRQKRGGGGLVVEDFAVVFPRTAHVRNLVFNLFFCRG